MKRSRKKAAGGLGSRTSGKSGCEHAAAVALIVLSISLAYSVSLHGTWAFDDSAIGQFQSIGSALDTRIGYREITYLSFLFNRWINPFDPLNYRVTNIIIHICNSVLVYFLAFLTLRLPACKERFGGYAFPVALLSGVVFALHPINIDAVAYIVQRMASLATMFVLLALYSYILARTTARRAASTVFYLFAILFVVLGIFSKENAVLAIPLVLLYEYFFLAGTERKGFIRRCSLVLFAGLLLLGGTSFFLGFQSTLFKLAGLFLHPNTPIHEMGWTATDVYWTPAQHIMTEFRVLVRYLMLLVVPLPRFLVFDWWGYPISRGLLAPPSTLLAVTFVFALIFFSIWKMKRLPFLSFGILWYFVAISLESFVALGSDLYFEHRNYLPLAGLVMGVFAQIVTGLRPGALRGARVWAAALVLATVLGSLTFERNLVWKDSVTLWQDTVNKAPGNVRALIALGNSCLDVSDLKSAERYYGEALKLSESGRRAHFFRDSAFSLGMVYLFSNDLKRAKGLLDVIDSQMPGSVVAHIMNGFYDFKKGDATGSIRLFDKALPRTVGLDRIITYTLRGEAYRSEGSAAKALEDYRKAVQLDPTFAAAYYGMGAVYLAQGRLDEALSFMNKTLALDPHHALALSDAADIALMKKAPIERSLLLARRAVANSPPFARPYATMGNVLIVAGRDREADNYYRLALRHGMKDYMVLFAKARAYYIKGDDAEADIYLRQLAAMKGVPEYIKKAVDAGLKGL